MTCRFFVRSFLLVVTTTTSRDQLQAGVAIDQLSYKENITSITNITGQCLLCELYLNLLPITCSPTLICVVKSVAGLLQRRMPFLGV